MPLKKSGDEIELQGDLLAVVAAESEGAAAKASPRARSSTSMLPVFVQESDLEAAKAAGRTSAGGGKVQTDEDARARTTTTTSSSTKEIERLFKESAHVVEAEYGIDAITHCCLEPHGSTVEWDGNKLTAHLSTQNVSRHRRAVLPTPLRITADRREVHCDYIGGGFGSKFAADYWGMAAAQISKKTGRPVKFMLDRDQELKIAGNRPSGYIKVRLGADKDGVDHGLGFGALGHRRRDRRRRQPDA